MGLFNGLITPGGGPGTTKEIIKKIYRTHIAVKLEKAGLSKIFIKASKYYKALFIGIIGERNVGRNLKGVYFFSGFNTNPQYKPIIIAPVEPFPQTRNFNPSGRYIGIKLTEV